MKSKFFFKLFLYSALLAGGIPGALAQESTPPDGFWIKCDLHDRAFTFSLDASVAVCESQILTRFSKLESNMKSYLRNQFAPDGTTYFQVNADIVSDFVDTELYPNKELELRLYDGPQYSRYIRLDLNNPFPSSSFNLPVIFEIRFMEKQFSNTHGKEGYTISSFRVLNDLLKKGPLSNVKTYIVPKRNSPWGTDGLELPCQLSVLTGPLRCSK